MREMIGTCMHDEWSDLIDVTECITVKLDQYRTKCTRGQRVEVERYDREKIQYCLGNESEELV